MATLGAEVTMACGRTMIDRGVTVRCLVEIHGGDDGCVWQTPTQAVEEELRVILGDDSAEIGVRWAQDKIVGLLYNGHPLGKSEWDTCLAVALPVVPWDGPPREAWEIDVGRAFRCDVCKKVVPASDGATDDMPEACYACWNKAHVSERCCAEQWIAKKGVHVRCVAGDGDRVGHEHQYEPACASAQRAVAEAIGVDIWAMSPAGLAVMRRLVAATSDVIAENVGACVEDVVRKVGQRLSTAVSEAEVAAPIDEQHGATLSAHCGTRPWDDMADMSKRLWIERARRLRKRWNVDEMTERLNANTDAMAELRDACRPEAEYMTGTRTLLECAASIVRRFRRQVIVNRDGWDKASAERNEMCRLHRLADEGRRGALSDLRAAEETLSIVKSQRDFLRAELDKVWAAVRLEPEADGADGIADAAVAVLERVRRERDETREALLAERKVIGALRNEMFGEKEFAVDAADYSAAIGAIRRLCHVADVARLAVERWQDNPRWLSGSSMYDLRAALEKK